MDDGDAGDHGAGALMETSKGATMTTEHTHSMKFAVRETVSILREHCACGYTRAVGIWCGQEHAGEWRAPDPVVEQPKFLYFDERGRPLNPPVPVKS